MTDDERALDVLKTLFIYLLGRPLVPQEYPGGQTLLSHAFAAVRAEERERCASLLEVMELGNPSGLSRNEQLHIFTVLQKCADILRATPKEEER